MKNNFYFTHLYITINNTDSGGTLFKGFLIFDMPSSYYGLTRHSIRAHPVLPGTIRVLHGLPDSSHGSPQLEGRSAYGLAWDGGARRDGVRGYTPPSGDHRVSCSG